MTMIELLMALAVIGILSSIAVTIMSGRSEKLRAQEAVTEIGQISLAISLYETRPDRLAAGVPDDLTALNIDPALLIDPWGRPYRYFKPGNSDAALARLSRSGGPLNRDYDLYSLGPDGASRPSIGEDLSVDDVLRAAQGRFIGTAADYGIEAVALQFSASPTVGTDGPSVGMDPRSGR